MTTQPVTLATLPDVTEQDVFDHVARHLLTQGQPSVEDDCGHTNCLYRGPNGLSCAAGCLMTDEEYEKINDELTRHHPHDPDVSIEGKSWDQLAASGFVPDVHSNLVDALQQVHDVRKASSARETTQEWAESLRTLADARGLSTEVLDEFAPTP